jgi:hypothetical protein
VVCVIGVPPCHAPMRCGANEPLASGIHILTEGSRGYTACWTIRQVSNVVRAHRTNSCKGLCWQHMTAALRFRSVNFAG